MVTAEQAINFSDMVKIVNDATIDAKAKVTAIQNLKSQVSIGDMFDMQMLMNKLSQLSEMVTNVMAAANQSTLSMARNIK